MFYELAKDKSLINVLRKADLDSVTSNLVKEGASLSILKQSLMDNITSENMISYRKYIRIAKEEEDEEARRADERLSEEEDADEVFDNAVEESDARENLLNERKFGDSVNRLNEEKDAYKSLSALEYQVDILIQLATNSNIKVIKDGSKKKVRGAGNLYFKLGASRGESSQLLTLLQVIKNDPNYLEDKYGKLLVDGKLSGVKYSLTRQGKEETQNRKNIDVNEIIRKLDIILGVEFGVEENGRVYDKIDFLELFRLLHIQKYKRQPRNLVPRDKVKNERLKMLQRAKKSNSSMGANSQYERALRKVKAIQSNGASIQQSRLFIEDKIAELDKISQDKDKIVEKKIRKLSQSLRTVMSSGKIETKKIQELTATFKDMQNNKEKYLKEATEELEKEIKAEKRKLRSLTHDLGSFDTSETISKFSQYLNRFKQGDPIASIKTLLTKGINLLTPLRTYSNNMAKITRQSEGKITQGFTQFLQENPDVSIVDGYFEGFPGLSIQEMGEFEELSNKYDTKEEALQEIVNTLDEMVNEKKSAREEEQ